MWQMLGQAGVQMMMRGLHLRVVGCCKAVLQVHSIAATFLPSSNSTLPYLQTGSCPSALPHVPHAQQASVDSDTATHLSPLHGVVTSTQSLDLHSHPCELAEAVPCPFNPTCYHTVV